MNFSTAVDYVISNQAQAFHVVFRRAGADWVGADLYLLAFEDVDCRPDNKDAYTLFYVGGNFGDYAGGEDAWLPDQVPDDIRTFDFHPAPALLDPGAMLTMVVEDLLALLGVVDIEK
jgi:hypothetical protein